MQAANRDALIAIVDTILRRAELPRVGRVVQEINDMDIRELTSICFILFSESPTLIANDC